jgi:hypothetical protein
MATMNGSPNQGRMASVARSPLSRSSVPGPARRPMAKPVARVGQMRSAPPGSKALSPKRPSSANGRGIPSAHPNDAHRTAAVDPRYHMNNMVHDAMMEQLQRGTVKAGLQDLNDDISGPR